MDKQTGTKKRKRDEEEVPLKSKKDRRKEEKENEKVKETQKSKKTQTTTKPTPTKATQQNGGKGKEKVKEKGKATKEAEKEPRKRTREPDPPKTWVACFSRSNRSFCPDCSALLPLTTGKEIVCEVCSFEMNSEILDGQPIVTTFEPKQLTLHQRQLKKKKKKNEDGNQRATVFSQNILQINRSLNYRLTRSARNALTLECFFTPPSYALWMKVKLSFMNARNAGA